MAAWRRHASAMVLVTAFGLQAQEGSLKIHDTNHSGAVEESIIDCDNLAAQFCMNGMGDDLDRYNTDLKEDLATILNEELEAIYGHDPIEESKKRLAAFGIEFQDSVSDEDLELLLKPASVRSFSERFRREELLRNAHDFFKNQKPYCDRDLRADTTESHKEGAAELEKQLQVLSTQVYAPMVFWDAVYPKTDYSVTSKHEIELREVLSESGLSGKIHYYSSRWQGSDEDKRILSELFPTMLDAVYAYQEKVLNEARQSLVPYRDALIREHFYRFVGGLYDSENSVYFHPDDFTVITAGVPYYTVGGTIVFGSAGLKDLAVQDRLKKALVEIKKQIPISRTYALDSIPKEGKKRISFLERDRELYYFVADDLKKIEALNLEGDRAGAAHKLDELAQKVIADKRMQDLIFYGEDKNALTAPAGELSEHRLWESRLDRLCAVQEEAWGHLIDAQTEGVYLDAMRSRNVVTRVTERLYPGKDKASVLEMYAETQEAVAEIFEERILPRISDPQKAAAARKAFEDLPLYWPISPEEIPYKSATSLPFEVIDFEKLDDLLPFDHHYGGFKGGGLDVFVQTNAHMASEFAIGTRQAQAEIALYPSLFQFFSLHPFSIVNVTAHEIGHAFGPRVSSQRGYSLRTEFAEFFDCMGSKDSVQAKSNQLDECVADWVAAETLAKMIAKLPKEKRKTKTVESLQALCSFYQWSPMGSTSNTHPLSITRINAIFGAQPDLRENLGCPRDGGRYKYCSLGANPEPKIKKSIP